eukprot:5400611-Prymnesium_polylepis.2
MPIGMRIVQQRHARQSGGVLQPESYYFNVIIYLSIYELGARHSVSCGVRCLLFRRSCSSSLHPGSWAGRCAGPGAA